MENNFYSNSTQPNQPTYTYTSTSSQVKPLSGWASLMAILTIIGGVFSSLTIVGAIIGIPQIIAGVKLLKGIESSKSISVSDKQTAETFANLNSYFKILGIMFIVSVVLSVLFGLLFLVLGVGALMQNFGNTRY